MTSGATTAAGVFSIATPAPLLTEPNHSRCIVATGVASTVRIAVAALAASVKMIRASTLMLAALTVSTTSSAALKARSSPRRKPALSKSATSPASANVVRTTERNVAPGGTGGAGDGDGAGGGGGTSAT